MSQASTEICSKCILPASTPGIEFDQFGVCNYCRSYVPMSVKGEAEIRSRMPLKASVMTAWWELVEAVTAPSSC